MAINAYDEERSGVSLTMPILSGAHMARLIGVTDLGIQLQNKFGENRPPRRELNLTFELVSKFMLDSEGNEVADKPCWVYDTIRLYHPSAEGAKSTTYANDLDPKHEFKYDFLAMLDCPIILNLGKNKNGKENKILSTTSMLEGMPCPPSINEPHYFDLDEADPNHEKFDKLPDWVKKAITDSVDFERSTFGSTFSGGATGGSEVGTINYGVDPDDDMPF